MQFETETLREIISDHIFYALIIIGLTLTIHHSVSVEVWKEIWNLILLLATSGLVLNVLSFLKSMKLRIVIEYANTSKDDSDENPFDEVDKETTKE